MNDFLKQLAERSKKNIPRNEGDYEKDGLLYCGKCHSPKQGKYFAEDGSYITPRILCDCEQEARNRKEEEVKKLAEKFKEAQEAYAVLSDPEKRKQYENYQNCKRLERTD